MGILFPDSVKSSTDILEENWRSVRRVSPKHSITKSIPSQRIAKVEAENFVGIYGHPYEGNLVSFFYITVYSILCHKTIEMVLNHSNCAYIDKQMCRLSSTIAKI
jgi:hypothetical protein